MSRCLQRPGCHGLVDVDVRPAEVEGGGGRVNSSAYSTLGDWIPVDIGGYRGLGVE